MNVLTNQEPYHVSTSHSCLHAIGRGQRQEGHFHQNCPCPTDGIYVRELSSVIKPGGIHNARQTPPVRHHCLRSSNWLTQSRLPSMYTGLNPVSLSHQEEVWNFFVFLLLSFLLHLQRNLALWYRLGVFIYSMDLLCRQHFYDHSPVFYWWHFPRHIRLGWHHSRTRGEKVCNWIPFYFQSRIL